MKNLKAFIAVIAMTLLVTSSAMANSSTETTSKEELRDEVVDLLGNHPFDDVDNTIEATVSFMLNKHNEIVVISVESRSEGVEGFVKQKLNYKKINAIGLKNGKIYELPVIIVE